MSVVYIGPKSRTERPRKTKIGRDVTHIQGRKVKGQGHQDALLTAALKREAGAVMTVRTYWAWETTATLRLLGGARGAGAPTREERGGGISCRHAQPVCFVVILRRFSQIYQQIC